MRRGRPYLCSSVLALALLAGACGDDDEPKPGGGEAGRHEAVKPPRGWRTVANRAAGFTVSVPRGWTARPRRGGTFIRSDDRLVAITVAADRSSEGKQSDPAAYARDTLGALPGFEGSVTPRPRRVADSPYRTSVVDGEGTLSAGRGLQRISVAALQRPGRVTYTAVVFRNGRLRVPLNERRIGRLLASLRG